MNQPFVEKYRPKILKDIIMGDVNKLLLSNILSGSVFPNLLLYGPPGTGKTSAILSMVETYCDKKSYKMTILHLNASDERGIETIRNQIYAFVVSKPLVGNGIKFIILDEVDYMTKNAQQSLKYLLENMVSQMNVCFCLICNYISKIDMGLQDEFIKIRFNNLPQDIIFDKLKYICKQENIVLTDSKIMNIIYLYKSDIRSMINYIQLCNQNKSNTKQYDVLNDSVYVDFIEMIKYKSSDKMEEFIYRIICDFNIEKTDFMKKFFNYLIYQGQILNSELLLNMEKIVHCDGMNDNTVLWKYFFETMKSMI